MDSPDKIFVYFVMSDGGLVIYEVALDNGSLTADSVMKLHQSETLSDLQNHEALTNTQQDYKRMIF